MNKRTETAGHQLLQQDGPRRTLTLVLVIEEAHHVLYKHSNQNESVIEMLLRQCREIGIAVIVIDQHPHLISSAALGNTYTSICLNLKDPRDIAKAAALSLVPVPEAKHLSLLPVGRGIVKLQDRWQMPLVVDFPHVDIEKGNVTDNKLTRYIRRKTTLSDSSQSLRRTQDVLTHSRVPDKAFEDTAKRFLNDVRHHPNSGVDARYKRLGFSADRGHRLKQKLVALGILEDQSVAIGRSRRTILRLAKPSTHTSAQPHNESIAHAYWKHHYAKHYLQQGYRIRLEAPRPGGRTDVLATLKDETIAIEIETGNSNATANVRANLLAGHTRILIIATTQQAWTQIHRKLHQAGLLLPQVEAIVAGR